MSLSKPSIFGPGGWDAIHIFATRCTSKFWYSRFDEDVRWYQSKMHCLECLTDFGELIEKDPPLKRKTVYKDGIDVTMFYWSVDAHNKVNKKLGKPEYSKEKAFEFYYKNKPCSSDCESNISSEVKTLIDDYKYEGKYLSDFNVPNYVILSCVYMT